LSSAAVQRCLVALRIAIRVAARSTCRDSATPTVRLELRLVRPEDRETSASRVSWVNDA
jgi:hypothetical protein